MASSPWGLPAGSSNSPLRIRKDQEIKKIFQVAGSYLPFYPFAYLRTVLPRLLKLFLNIHTDKNQELSDLSREEFLVRINENGALYGTDPVALDPVKQDSTSREFYLLPEEGSDTCR